MSFLNFLSTAVEVDQICTQFERFEADVRQGVLEFLQHLGSVERLPLAATAAASIDAET